MGEYPNGTPAPLSHGCVCACMYLYMYAHTYIYMSVYMYVYVYVYVYIYTYTCSRPPCRGAQRSKRPLRAAAHRLHDLDHRAAPREEFDDTWVYRL
jgi:hypothetical protein